VNIQLVVASAEGSHSHSYHTEKLAAWLLYLGLSQQPGCIHTLGFTEQFRNTFRDSEREEGFRRYIVTFWVSSKSLFMKTVWKRKWIWYL